MSVSITAYNLGNAPSDAMGSVDVRIISTPGSRKEWAKPALSIFKTLEDLCQKYKQESA